MSNTGDRYLDPILFVAGNRIIPEKVMIVDELNEHVRMHARDFAPEREPFLRDYLRGACSLEFPPYNDDKTRNVFIEAIRDAIPKDPKLSATVPENAKQQELPSSLYERPVEHLVNGEPFAPLISEADMKQYRDAIAFYMMLEMKLNDNGYKTILHDSVKSLENRGISSPSAEQLFNELRTALSSETNKVATAEMLRNLHHGGIEGAVDYLHISPEICREVDGLMDYITPRGFPLNDVINWMFGRAEPHMEGKSIQEKLTVGLEARINHLIEHHRAGLKNFTAVPNEIENERLVCGMMDYLPPVLSTLFFEEGGQVIFTLGPDLTELQNMPATGFHITYESATNPENSMHQVFTSQELGLPKSTRTLVHEINHMFYPDMIGMSWASHADDLLMRDQERIKYLKNLVDQYVKGDEDIKSKVLEGLNLPEFQVDGKSFFDMTDNTSMLTFIGAVNEAYHYLQMESPTYNRIGTYSNPLDRFREVIPRYAEMRYVAHIDHPDLMKFIVPGITDIYENMYLPHLEERLEQIRQTRPLKSEALMSSVDPASLYEHKFVEPRFSQEWTEEVIGGVHIRHRAGDNRSVMSDFADVVTSPTVDKAVIMDALDARPASTAHAGTAPEMGGSILQPLLQAPSAAALSANNIVNYKKAGVSPTVNIDAFSISTDGQIVRAPAMAVIP